MAFTLAAAAAKAIAAHLNQHPFYGDNLHTPPQPQELRPQTRRLSLIIKMKIKDFLSNPWVGGIGTVVGIISVLLTLYLYFASKQSRNLVVNLSPVDVLIVKVKDGQASKVAVSYDGTLVTSDVTAVEIELWNGGNVPIKKENVLEPINIIFDGAVILEANVRGVSRKVIQLTIDDSGRQAGKVGLNWTIMEHDDGAVLQVIYAGKPSVLPRIEGTIEGQHKVTLTKGFLNGKWNGEATMSCIFGLGFFLVGLKEYCLGRRNWTNIFSMVGGVICIVWPFIVAEGAPAFVFRSYPQ